MHTVPTRHRDATQANAACLIPSHLTLRSASTPPPGIAAIVSRLTRDQIRQGIDPAQAATNAIALMQRACPVAVPAAESDTDASERKTLNRSEGQKAQEPASARSRSAGGTVHDQRPGGRGGRQSADGARLPAADGAADAWGAVHADRTGRIRAEFRPSLCRRRFPASRTPSARTGGASMTTHTPRVQAAGLRAEWRRLARLLTDPAVELDVDTFADVLACYGRLQAAGVRVDPMAAAFIQQGAYSLLMSGEGACHV